MITPDGLTLAEEGWVAATHETASAASYFALAQEIDGDEDVLGHVELVRDAALRLAGALARLGAADERLQRQAFYAVR